MRSHHPARLLVRRLAVATLVVGTAVGSSVLPAGAAPEPVAAAVTGDFGTPVGLFPLSDTVFEGTWDGDTGALEGQFLFPAITVEVTTPVPATIGLQLEQPDPATGSVDLATNVATFDTTLVLNLLTIDIGAGSFPVAPCRYSAPAQLSGTFDPATNIVSLADADMSLAPILDPNRCFFEQLGSNIDSIIDGALLGPSSFAASFNVTENSAAPPPEPCEFDVEIPADDPDCVPPSPPAPPAEPAAAPATFAG